MVVKTEHVCVFFAMIHQKHSVTNVVLRQLL